MKRYLLPLLVFCVLVGFLAVGLKLNPREVPSPLIGKPAPAFSLPRLDSPAQKLAAQDMRGKVWVLNVWASWCGPCRQEHALIAELAKSGGAAVIGLNYKDKTTDATAWLAELGNPYTATVSDIEGLIGIDYGVYGVPETFVIDQAGVIRLKHIGPMTPEALRGTVLPMLRKLGA
jgi:cytochrome c biogenesis protein CcmG, thiol:disulfide interchange protein DsbE